MKSGILKDTSPFHQLFILASSIIIIGLLSSLASILIAIPIFNVNIFHETNDIYTNISLLKYLQMMQTIGLFILPAFATAFFIFKHPIKELKFTSSPLKSFGVGLIIIVASQPLISYLGELNSQISFPIELSNIERWLQTKEENAANVIAKFLSNPSQFHFVLNTIIIAILPALGEELIFRGLAQPLFIRIFENKHTAVWMTAFLFSALHMQFYGLFPRMMLGGILGYIFLYSRNIWLPIVIHFTNNFMALVIFRFYNNNAILNPLESHNEFSVNYTLLTISSIAVFVGIKWFRFHNKTAIIGNN